MKDYLTCLCSSGKKTKVAFLNLEKTVRKSMKLIVVVAIDIGTIFSGFAFILYDDWRKVYNRSWIDGYLTSQKTPTSLLLKKDLSESYFGYEAEDKFLEMTPNERHHNYFFFQHFGNILHEDLVCVLSLFSFALNKSYRANYLLHEICNLVNCSHFHS